MSIPKAYPVDQRVHDTLQAITQAAMADDPTFAVLDQARVCIQKLYDAMQYAELERDLLAEYIAEHGGLPSPPTARAMQGDTINE